MQCAVSWVGKDKSANSEGNVYEKDFFHENRRDDESSTEKFVNEIKDITEQRAPLIFWRGLEHELNLLGRWGNPPGRGRKIKRFYMQSYYPGVQGWGLLLRLQLRSLSKGVLSSHLEKDERLILGHLCIYLWKRHALCYAVFGFARNRWLNTLYGIVWETKFGRWDA